MLISLIHIPSLGMLLTPGWQSLGKVNTPPTPVEAQYLRTLVEEDETELAHIRQAKSGLLAREEVVCAMMKNNRAILSPIRHLPPEILAIIFILWHETSEIQSRTQSHTPYRIAHVSSRWRAIALNTPRLWTRARLCSSNQKAR